MTYERFHATFVGVVATLVGSIVVAGLAEFLIGVVDLLARVWLPVLPEPSSYMQSTLALLSCLFTPYSG